MIYLKYSSPKFIKIGKRAVNANEKLQITIEQKKTASKLSSWLACDMKTQSTESWVWVFGIFTFLRFVVVHYYALAADYSADVVLADDVLVVTYSTQKNIDT